MIPGKKILLPIGGKEIHSLTSFIYFIHFYMIFTLWHSATLIERLLKFDYFILGCIIFTSFALVIFTRKMINHLGNTRLSSHFKINI